MKPAYFGEHRTTFSFARNEKLILHIRSIGNAQKNLPILRVFACNSHQHNKVLSAREPTPAIPAPPSPSLDELKAAATNKLVPSRSVRRYNADYEIFLAFAKHHSINVETVTDDELLAFVEHLKSKFQASTVNTKFSAVKKLLTVHGNCPKTINWSQQSHQQKLRQETRM